MCCTICMENETSSITKTSFAYRQMYSTKIIKICYDTSYILTSKQHFRFILFWRLSQKKKSIINSSLSKHLKPTEKNMTWCRWLWHYFYQGKLLLQINRWIKNYMKTWHMQSYTHEKYVLWCRFYCEGFNFFFRSIYDQYIVLTIYTEMILARLCLLYFPCALYQTHLRVCLSNK
jgi:hypothetical protein